MISSSSASQDCALQRILSSVDIVANLTQSSSPQQVRSTFSKFSLNDVFLNNIDQNVVSLDVGFSLADIQIYGSLHHVAAEIMDQVTVLTCLTMSDRKRDSFYIIQYLLSRN